MRPGSLASPWIYGVRSFRPYTPHMRHAKAHFFLRFAVAGFLLTVLASKSAICCRTQARYSASAGDPCTASRFSSFLNAARFIFSLWLSWAPVLKTSSGRTAAPPV